MSLSDRCRDEIIELHAFFQDWFTGRTGGTDIRFARLSDALAADFRYILPEGRIADRTEILTMLRRAFDSHLKFRIEIRNIQIISESERNSLVFFEEHQWTGDRHTARFNTAMFRSDPDGPRGVVWAYLHETWQLGLAPADGS